ncbi:hypothetical protein M9H77_27222 [Catharanthus roseus]|uniref:Uncharacterized protein n=1 Tax=Catharanthus roseus TaxID=4058 RepID=A0ACC0ACR8_CATRO|nr:hypothetical protein M9H77_27222 [Catharanthus roseus]
MTRRFSPVNPSSHKKIFTMRFILFFCKSKSFDVKAFLTSERDKSSLPYLIADLTSLKESGLSRDGIVRLPSFSISLSLFSFPHGSLSTPTNRQSKVTKKTGEQQRSTENWNRERKIAAELQNQKKTRESRRLQKTDSEDTVWKRRARDCTENEAAAIKRRKSTGHQRTARVARPNRPGIP